MFIPKGLIYSNPHHQPDKIIIIIRKVQSLEWNRKVYEFHIETIFISTQFTRGAAMLYRLLHLPTYRRDECMDALESLPQLPDIRLGHLLSISESLFSVSLCLILPFEFLYFLFPRGYVTKVMNEPIRGCLYILQHFLGCEKLSVGDFVGVYVCPMFVFVPSTQYF